MISLEERIYLRWLARLAWRDTGHILEIGPWLGGSTLCLAEGARARREAPRHRIYAVDNFLWRPFMDERARLGLRPGDSFAPHFRAHVAAFSKLVIDLEASLPDEEIPGDSEAAAQRDQHTGEREIFRWEKREPIEILFVDGAKSWRGLRHLLISVGESLQPGSLLVCQDLKYWGCYWVPMVLGRLERWLELIHDVRSGDCVAFRLGDALPASELAAIPQDVHAADPGEAFAALDRLGQALLRSGDELAPHNLALAKVKFLAHRGDLDGACRAFRRSQADWPLFRRRVQLERARSYLTKVRERRVPDRWALVLAADAARLAARVRGPLGRLRRGGAA
jgi:hypothetical protein